MADLDRTMTVEKAVVAGWTLSRGWETDDELRSFAEALARKRTRVAFPDDFVAAARNLETRLLARHNSQTDEGAHLPGTSPRSACVRRPPWNASAVQLTWWFIKEADPVGVPVDWWGLPERWLALFGPTGRFRVDPPIACRLEDMTARDYVGKRPAESRPTFYPPKDRRQQEDDIDSLDDLPHESDDLS